MLEMDHDEYGEIINGPKTYKVIYNKIKNGKSVIIGWTDEAGSHYDIVLTHNPYKEDYNLLRQGLRSWYLYVTIIGIGGFGFNFESAKDPEYVGEKLNIRCKDTYEKLTELINAVILYEED